MIQQVLWEKINNFQFDRPGTTLTFAKRLSRENGWAASYTERVIEEYKKFIFLCCISEKEITPSDQVDQAWHLHLTFTKSYWIDLCRDTIAKDIHHNPTMGGKAEAEKFNNSYSYLFKQYYETFDEHPPKDIWFNNKERFSDIDFERVNLRKYWLLKKPKVDLKKMFFIGMVIIFAVSAISAEGNGNVILFIVLIAILIIVSLFRGGKNSGGGSGGGCSTGCTTGHGDSGCSASGCSGCGSGCGGGD